MSSLVCEMTVGPMAIEIYQSEAPPSNGFLLTESAISYHHSAADLLDIIGQDVISALRNRNIQLPFRGYVLVKGEQHVVNRQE